MRKIVIQLLVPLLTFLVSCQSETEDPRVDCSASTLSIDLVNTTDANCGQATGMIEVEGTGGTEPYSYSLNTGQNSSDGSFTGLAATVYTVTLKDRDNCSITLSAAVNNIDGVILTSVTSAESGCGETNGEIVINADAGDPPYTYFLNSGSPQEENTFTSLSQGTYTAHVVDASDCETSQEIKVKSGVSWSGEVEGIIMNNCAIPTCHGGTQPPDYRVFANVQSKAAEIKQRTQAGSMPPTGPLSASLVQTIACWVDDGALNN